MNRLIAPSLLAADFGNLQRDIMMINESEADWLHLDIMDGVFVPNISFGFPVLQSVKKHTTKPMDVHLMIVQPEKFFQELKDLGTYMLTVHYEACPHLHRTIQSIKAMGMKAGVSLNPHTPVSVLEDIVCDADMILLMSVNPGFGGQKFIPNTYKKVKTLHEMIVSQNTDTLIQVDGGVDTSNIAALSDVGVNVFVAGSFVFQSADPKKTILDLKSVK